MTPLPAPAAILFDWDNTLVDNWAAIAGALNAARGAFGHPEMSEAAVRGWVRQSMRNSFPDMFGEAWTEARDIFYRSFRAKHLEALKPLPGAGELLRRLNGLGLYVGIVSNKHGGYLRKEIGHLAWTRPDTAGGRGRRCRRGQARGRARRPGAQRIGHRPAPARSGLSATLRSTWNAPSARVARRFCGRRKTSRKRASATGRRRPWRNPPKGY